MIIIIIMNNNNDDDNTNSYYHFHDSIFAACEGADDDPLRPRVVVNLRPADGLLGYKNNKY